MKCPNVDCGFEPEKPTKFCPECGKKMASEQKPRVVLCKNITEEGTVCNAEIQINFKFCGECGITVTKEMFERQIHVCPKCKNEVPPGNKFCFNCGYKVVDKDNTASTSQPKEKTALTKQYQMGPQGDNEKLTATEFSANLQNVEDQNQGFDGKEETEDKRGEREVVKNPAGGESFVLINLTEKEEFVSMEAITDLPHGEIKGNSGAETLPKPMAVSQPIDEERRDKNDNKTELADNSVGHCIQETAAVCQGSVHNESMTMESSADSSKDSGVICDLSPHSSEGPAPIDRDNARNAETVPVNIMERIETTDKAITDLSHGEMQGNCGVEPLPKPMAVSQSIDVETKDKNDNKTELADNSVGHCIQETAAVCQGSVHNESVTMESSADSSNDSGVIGDKSPHSPEGPTPTDRDNARNAEAVPVNTMEGIETTDKVGDIPHTVDGAADSSLASGLVQQFESVTIQNQLSPVNTKDYDQIVSMNNVNDDEQSKTESESEEGDFSSDDSSVKHDENVGETNKGNERKRKKKTSKKAYEAKRERKRGKLEIQKKGEIDDKSAQASVVEKQSKQEKHTVKVVKEDTIEPHKFMKPVQEQSQAAKKNEVVAQKEIVMEISLDESRNGGDEKVDNHSVGKDMPAASGNGSNMKVFGSYVEAETDTLTSSDFDVRGASSMGNGLFELDKKKTKETDNKNKNASPVKATGSGSTQESWKTTGNEQASGVRTRSMTKDVENKQKKQNLEAESKKKPEVPKSSILGHTNERTVRVHFIALISPDFNLNIETDIVYILGDLDKERGWNNLNHVMKHTGKYWGGCLEYEYICDIPYSHLARDRGLEYKYWIVKYKGSDRKELWDCYLKYGRTGEGVNRILNIPGKMKSSVPDVLHKFDGIVNREPESHGILERVKDTIIDYFSKSGKLKRDCEQFIEFFCAHHMVFDSPSSVKENTDKTVLLLYQMRQIYVTDGRAWAIDPDFKREIGNTILRRLIEHLTTAKQTNDRQTSFIIALTVASLVKAFPVTEINLSDNQQGILCKALLVESNEGEKSCFEMEFINKHYSKQRAVIKDGILQILKSVVYGKSKDPSWLFLVPLIHFLNGDCKPFDYPPTAYGHQEDRPTWWGIMAFDGAVPNFQKKDRTWTIPLKDVLEQLQPLFKVDYFLPRTFMAALNIREVMAVLETRQIPVDVCCASLNYFMKISVPDWYQFPIQATPAEQMVRKCFEIVQQMIKSDSETRQCSEETLIHQQLSCKVAEDMYVNALKINRTIVEGHAMHLFLYCIDSFTTAREKFLSTLDKDKEIKANLKIIRDLDTSRIIQRMLQETQDWLRRNYCYWYRYTLPCLNIWNCMILSDEYSRKETLDTWNGALANALEKQLNSHLSNVSAESFIQVYCNTVDSHKARMQEVMSKVVIKAIEGGYKFDFGGFHERERKRLGHLLSDMFVNYWEKMLRASSDPPDETILRLVLTWPPFTSFLQVLSKYQEDIKRDCLLSPACTEKLVMAISVVEGRCDALNSGGITVTKLRELAKHEEKFVPVVDLVKNKDFEGKMVTKLLKLRTREIAEVEHKAKLVTSLTSVCHFLPNVSLSKQDAVLGKVANIGHYSVKDFCKPLGVHSLDKIEDCHQNMTAFDLSPEVDQMLEPLHEANKSTTFAKLWEQRCNEQQGNCSTLDDVVKNVWNPVNVKWTTISMNIASGDIVFSHLEHHVGKTFKDDFEAMKYELVVMGINEKIVTKRIKQLQQYRQLETSVKGAKVILKFAQQYHLTGDFKQIRNIASHENMEMKMKDFDESLMDTCRILKDITPYQSNCLNALVKSEPLITWLKESMKKDGLKELKVFVDLALISAGEQPLDIDRVQALNTAILGYSPLIFDLKPDADYRELLEKCRLVWKELKTNPKLSEKLVDSNRHLEWLKTIQKAHGSVEVSSLAQAEAINSGGVFNCGYVWKVQEDIMLEPAKVLKLHVRGQDPSEARNNTYDQLQDLQSRLMLVAGRAEKEKTQGKDEVEVFTEVFDGVKRLSSVYIKLYDAGCVLFKTWQASFFCNPQIPVCGMLDFGQGVEKIKGRRTKEEDTGFIIHKLAKFLEVCLDEWLHYINEKRNTYLHLNYFTIDQLVLLQRELVKIGTDEEPSIMIYPLLSAVKKDCTPADLNEAINQAQQQLDQIDEEMATSSNEEEQEDTEDELRQKFIEEIIKAGFERTIAVKALESVKPDQVDEGIVWCMQHESDSDNEMETETLADGNVGEAPKTVKLSAQLQHSDSTVLSLASTYVKEFAADDREFGVQPLIRSLEALWKAFIGSISSNLKDYLSLEHLGLILKNLSHRCTFQIDRPLLAGFKPGVPNLVIVPAGDVINTVLTIYLMTDSQPLPQSDEVLMCNLETTLDEVDIFWRRAIFDGGKKIHCLVNADLLDFDVSDRAEKLLEGYIQQTNHEAPDYRLIVICGSDNEYRSRIVAALDKFRRPALPVNLHNISKYLTDKFQVTKAAQGAIPAALVDFENCSVRVIRSWRAGVGKTLYKERRERQLGMLLAARGQEHYSVTVPLQEKKINLDAFIKVLLRKTTEPGAPVSRIFHLDISHEVQEGVDFLLFNLLVLRCLTDKTGHVWRRSDLDLYLVENMPLMKTATRRGGDLQYLHSILSILPSMTCHSPRESLEVLTGETIEGYRPEDQLFDLDMFQSPVFQRPFQYLLRLDTGRQLQDVNPHQVEGTEQDCLRILLRHCGIRDPSWSELHHFVWFLNTQLHDYEGNNFVSIAAAEDLPGFAKFVLRFLIQMSRDFATRSLNMSEESPVMRMQNDDDDEEEADDNVLQRFQMRRTWESSPHPYLFFNSDRMTFTFLGFYIDRQSGNLIDLQTGTELERGIMAQNLYDALVRNHVPIQENFDGLPRGEKITKLCQVMGMDMPYDPDDTYELTTDNVKKIMAIYMRFRCDIPVIIMGETGCGKTRLVKFMCALQVPPGVDGTNMVLMKVHGGTTNADIKRKVREAERIAKQNVQKFGPHMYTVLFFDEANTTEAIGLIKEIMCDKTMEGEKLELCQNLKIVAACNPYRKHSDELIKKLEQAGLGYHVDADKTTDRLGRVPMRRLVYRVQPLPQSLLPLVWDFGQLNTQVEDLYIRQMVRRYIRERKLPDIPGLVEVVSAVLTESQDYMRQQEDECSFVSLRDVDRVLSVMSWFYGQSQHTRTLFMQMDGVLYGEGSGEDDYANNIDDEEEEEEEEDQIPAGRQNLSDVTRSLILALGVCYHACLKDREDYREHVVQHFLRPCELPGGADQMHAEIVTCQDVFLSNVRLEKNIARNMALKENVFMMVVCIELRIPLFLVGKPGSSKSLAKTIVSDAMQGNAAHEQLFKELKQVQMVSFQCSPLSTPDGIVGTFRQCAKFQEDKDLTNFVSIVVLDEVGLAEDSPRMPLKTLHPLLEDGCQGDEKPEEYKKVAFIGISNWALDPAKMNRGILVQREVPDIEELKNSAEGICSNDDTVKRLMKPLIEPMANSYLKIFKQASNHREFFGLRDFYSLIKMVFSFVEKSKQPPTWFEMLHAIKRNFGGLEDIDPETRFRKALTGKININDQLRPGDPECSPAALIEACLFDTNRTDSESRYLLLLTENYGALPLLQQQIIAKQNEIRPVTIFGSSFPSDQEYTQVCRNINKIKVCMETGNTVVLLNLENLYESLYDALNQYYVYFGGERYVDLGLGTHRVKCRVHKQFRLIVVAEKQVVYDKFPIPLINRLEKHFLTINTMLTREQHKIVGELKKWAGTFVEQKKQPWEQQRTKQGYSIGDVFMGYHDDTCSAVVLHVWRDFSHAERDEAMIQILSDAKQLLLWVATPDSVVRLQKSELPVDEQRTLQACYFQQQTHNSLAEYLRHKLLEEGNKELFAQVTTHSKLLSTSDRVDISTATDIEVTNIMLETLQSFDTEQQFSNKIKSHLQKTETETTLLIVQCDSGNINGPLAACARYCVMDEYQKIRENMRFPFHVIFIIQLPRIAGGCFTGFQCGIWHSAHIDDLRPSEEGSPTIQQMQTTLPGTLVQHAIEEPVAMETEDIAPAVMYDMQGEANLVYNNTLDERPPAEGMDWEEGPPHGMMGPRTEAVQLEDVIVNLENRAGVLERGPKINISAIILSCVQTALSMVKDRETDVSRTTKRVALVLELLQRHTEQGTTRTFFTGISRLIAQLLQEKEKSNFRAENWLLEEAVKDENVQKAGTFRRACLQVLESKIAPILAGIIAYLDTNHNLDLLTQTESPWKQQIWLTMLNTPESLQLTYDYLQSPTRQSELQEVVVMTTECEGHLFSSHMPFSWLIYRQLGEILQTPQPDMAEEEAIPGNETERKVQLFERVFRESCVGKILAAMDDFDIRQDVTSSYLIDYVHFVYHANSEEELALVCQSVDYLVAQLNVTSQEDNSVLQSLIYIHQAYQILAPRLKYFRAMNAVWPECSSKIMDLKQDDPKNEMFKEEEFTFSALCLLIEDLTPNKEELNDTRRRTGWLNKVHRYRPVIEKVISLHLEDRHIFGEHSQASVNKAKCLWSRVLAVKLFLEHVCSKATEEKTDKITVKHCMPLFLMLGENVDFKELKALNVVEKFLKQCNKTAVQTFMATKETCCRCEKTMDEEAPIILPCKDMVCEHCLIDLMDEESKCPKCGRRIPEDFDRTKTKGKMSAEISKLKDYQKRCNSFFMDLVSQLCFAENTPPSDEVIDKLLGYIVCTIQPRRTAAGQKIQLTKELTIFDSGLDPNPVFRSFLLQLLMRTSGMTVENNLGKYLKQAEGLLQAGLQTRNVDVEEHYVELCLMVIQCLEDIFNQETEKDSEILSATNRLRNAKTSLCSEQLDINKLYALAFARYGLAVVAKCIQKAVSKGVNVLNQHERRLLEAAQVLCVDTDTKWPKIYLVKYLCRCYGVDTYQAVCRSQAACLRWLNMADLNREQVVEGPDRFVVCGPTYTEIREALTRVVLGEGLDKLQAKLQELGGHTDVMLTLAIHREIACASLYPENKRRVTENVKNHIQEFCGNRTGKQKELALAVLQNKLGVYCRQLTVQEGEDLHLQGIQGILVHFLSVLQQLEGAKTLMQPLIGLMKQPQQYSRSFIPTMPQDDLADIKEALLAARRQDGSENPVLYRCPNGHPYVIGNCGRPYVVARCKCGSDIGGQGHKPAPGNIIDTGEDRSETGHILGRADVRGQGHVQERQLSPIHCTCLRLLTHLAMYLGAANDPQDVVPLIRPDLVAQDIPQFLWDHIEADLNNFRGVLGCSIDDVFILMHSIINNIMITHNQGDHIGDEMSKLQTKKGRENWEERFSKTHLAPILQNTDATLKQGTRLMGQDQRLGADPLLCLLYEIDTPQDHIPPNRLQNIPAVWRYRTHITMDHLRREFDSKISTDKKGKSRHPVLKLFLQEEHYLRALRHIPSILKLHRALFQKYQRKLDKAEASTITVETIKRDMIAGEETAQLISDVAEAWDLIRNSLELYACPTELGGVTVPKELCRRPITDKTPISVLLPTMKESGLCTFALLDFLLRRQNDFLDRYMKETKRNPESFTTANPVDITAAHLISYDPQQDILPMVLANCQYSFEIGKGTKIEYDFNGLERQLMDRFFYSKSRIHIDRVLQIETMIYRAEFTNAAVFKKLNEKIPQEPLTLAVKHQISAEIRSLPDLCQSLDNLDISISFLKSVGGDPEQNLHGFMLETLKMENPLLSQKARQDCRFKHTQSLWMLLSFLRTKKMAEHRQGRQSMFESVPQEFHEELSEDLQTELETYFREMSIEKLGVFIEVLHEYIILGVSVKMNQDDEDFEDTTIRKLKGWLQGYLGEQDTPAMDIRVLTNFPEGILYKHAVALWIRGYNMLCEKHDGHRR